MMEQQHISKTENSKAKKAQLYAVYSVYSDWVQRLPLACRKGCAACCTGSVTISSLEGENILEFIKNRGRDQWLSAKLAQASPGNNRTLLTANQFAEACLRQQEIVAESFGCWDFTPCIFLEDDICAIYEVRPFGCRSFGSLVQCRKDTAAEMAPIHLTVNTVFTQIVEHISSDGGHWGIMTDILHSLVKSQNLVHSSHTPNARPIPGLLLESHEAQEVHLLVRKLGEYSSDMEQLADMIDNFIPIL